MNRLDLRRNSSEKREEKIIAEKVISQAGATCVDCVEKFAYVEARLFKRPGSSIQVDSPPGRETGVGGGGGI